MNQKLSLEQLDTTAYNRLQGFSVDPMQHGVVDNLIKPIFRIIWIETNRHILNSPPGKASVISIGINRSGFFEQPAKLKTNHVIKINRC